jgi:hypothetical protein
MQPVLVEVTMQPVVRLVVLAVRAARAIVFRASSQGSRLVEYATSIFVVDGVVGIVSHVGDGAGSTASGTGCS